MDIAHARPRSKRSVRYRRGERLQFREDSEINIVARMTKQIAVRVALSCCFLAVAALAQDPDNAAIIEVVDRAYVQGIHIDGDAEKVRGGMHDSFIMFVRTDTGVNQVTREAWIERLAASKANAAASTTPRPKTTAKITVLDRTGDTAVAKVDLFRDGKQIFTDYISLYRLKDGWKLVGKVFQRH
jgi:hypothetical protein